MSASEAVMLYMPEGAIETLYYRRLILIMAIA